MLVLGQTVAFKYDKTIYRGKLAERIESVEIAEDGSTSKHYDYTVTVTHENGVPFGIAVGKNIAFDGALLGLCT